MLIISRRYLSHKAHRTNDMRVAKSGTDPWLKPSLERPLSNPALRTVTIHGSYTALRTWRRKQVLKPSSAISAELFFLLPEQEQKRQRGRMKILWQRAAGPSGWGWVTWKNHTWLYQRGITPGISAVAAFKGPPTDCGRRWLDTKRRMKEMRP